MSRPIPFYFPIVNEFKERILQYAKNSTEVAIVFESIKNDRMKVVDRIIRVFLKDDAEFLETADGVVIRLDYLVSVDLDLKPVDRCGIDSDANPCGDACEYWFFWTEEL